MLQKIFSNIAEAIAGRRGKVHAGPLRKAGSKTIANRLKGNTTEQVASGQLRKGDIVIVKAGEVVPGDGEIVEGAAVLDESSITGESAPVVREAGSDRSSVTGGARLVSEVIKIRLT
jgi:K+-transporting ATPase ATPase B chain